MNIYLLGLDQKFLSKRGNVWDSNDGFVIVARSSESARMIAQDNRADEGPIWLDESKTTCEMVGPYEGRAASKEYPNGWILLTSFIAG